MSSVSHGLSTLCVEGILTALGRICAKICKEMQIAIRRWKKVDYGRRESAKHRSANQISAPRLRGTRRFLPFLVRGTCTCKVGTGPSPHRMCMLTVLTAPIAVNILACIISGSCASELSRATNPTCLPILPFVSSGQESPWPPHRGPEYFWT